jgi:cellulose synthase/poly-beta-1,6-N-acetylglucosamine synthase-like glycosyltransferase
LNLGEVLLWALGVSGAVYALAMLALIIGLSRLRCGTETRLPSVSVVVAARNEEALIARCLDALLAQDYPRDRIEVVLVDDRSSDRTSEIARDYEARRPRLRVLRVKETLYACPKKNALALGIAHTRGELLLTTDADCRPGPGWVSGLVRHFAPEVGMVAGHSPLDLKSFTAEDAEHAEVSGVSNFGVHFNPLRSLRSLRFILLRVLNGGIVSRVLALEALAKAGLAAGSVGLGLPLSCAGRNLAYRREAFEAVGGFDRIGHIVAGDDVLLMRLIASRTPWKIRYATEPETVVPTSAGPSSPGRLYHQKVRHASKALHYGPAILTLAGVIYLFHALLLLGLPVALLSPGSFHTLSVALGIKCAADLAFLCRTGRALGMPPGLLRYFLLLEGVYLPYVVIFTVLGGMKNFCWK